MLHRLTPDEQSIALSGYLLGVIMSAAVLACIERRIASAPHTASFWGGIIAAYIVVIAITAPPTLLWCPWFYEGFWLTFVQLVIWAILWPIMYRLFFLSVPPHSQGFSLAGALAVGHAFWAMIILILVETHFQAPSGSANRYGMLLHCTRSLLSLAFAYIVWRLFRILPELLGKEKIRLEDREQQSVNTTDFSASKLLLRLLPPLTITCFISGFSSLAILPYFNIKEAYPEYTQLAFLLLFSFTSFFLYSYGNKILSFLFIGGILLCLPLTWLLTLPPTSWLYQTILVASIIGYQMQLFSGMLLTGNIAFRCAFPALYTTALLMCATSAMLAGALFQSYVQPLLPSSPIVTLMVCTFLCIASLPAAYRALHEINKNDKPSVAPALPIIRDIAQTINIFSVKYKLSPREKEVLELLMRGLSTGAMAETLHLKENSVRFYIRTLLKKTRVNSRMELVSTLINSDQ
ncbi:MAG: hypothetical protein BCS36_05560 [Desulfovibrio sp. MES5]|uniref:helix-turn-helix transcriptional regulator n=1 Tax=Desulfovibrio sp. MES5 TaxID=1899016 RepID=UPI000B9CADD5|nr:MAG: hypothetical protein BCS36_05560 [Desulfovibrio sp. MES5]